MISKDLKDKKIYVDLHLEISSEEIKKRIEQIVSEDSVFGEKELILFVENYVEKHLVYTILSELKISIK